MQTNSRPRSGSEWEHLTPQQQATQVEASYHRLLSNYNVHCAEEVRTKLGGDKARVTELAAELATLVERFIMRAQPTVGQFVVDTSTMEDEDSTSGMRALIRITSVQSVQTPSSYLGSPDFTTAALTSLPPPSPTFQAFQSSTTTPGELNVVGLAPTDSVYSLRMRPPVRMVQKLNKGLDADTGHKMLNEYVVLKEIGRGTMGKVKLAMNVRTNELRAIKVLQTNMIKDEIRLTSLQKEIAILKKLRHKNVVALHEVINDPGGKTYLVMEYLANGSASQMQNDGTCQRLPEKNVRKMIRSALTAIRYIHKHNIIHRDIKPDNILVTEDGVAKLSDFGVSDMLGDLLSDQQLSASITEVLGAQTMKGTPAFWAPELLTGDGTAAHATAIDVWALGITMYALLFGKVPFFAEGIRALSQKIISDPLQFPPEATFTQREVLCGMLNRDPTKRLTTVQLKNHPYFTSDPLSQSDAMASLQEHPMVFLTPEDMNEAISYCPPGINFQKEHDPSNDITIDPPPNVELDGGNPHVIKSKTRNRSSVTRDVPLSPESSSLAVRFIHRFRNTSVVIDNLDMETMLEQH